MKERGTAVCLDLSEFPPESEDLLCFVDRAADTGLSRLFINFGKFFPWSDENLLKSDFAYPEQHIAEIDRKSSFRGISITPVLTAFTDMTFVFRERGYRHLSSLERYIGGINTAATGSGKFLEDMIDDYISLFPGSDSIAVEVPDVSKFDSNEKNDFCSIIRRLSEYLDQNGRILVLDCGINRGNENFCNEMNIEIQAVSYNRKAERIFSGERYYIERNNGLVKLFGKELHVSRYKAFGNMFFINDLLKLNDRQVPESSRLTEYSLRIDSVLDIYYNLWQKIINTREMLSTYMRNRRESNPALLILEIHQAGVLLEEYIRSVDDFVRVYEKYYTKGILALWSNSKKDPVKEEVSRLKISLEQIENRIIQ